MSPYQTQTPRISRVCQLGMFPLTCGASTPSILTTGIFAALCDIFAMLLELLCTGKNERGHGGTLVTGQMAELLLRSHLMDRAAIVFMCRRIERLGTYVCGGCSV